jgi:CRP/FNR family transcriptional regulator, nitrogen oxide reductase regulator
MSKGTMTRLCRRRFPCLTLRKEQTERLHKIDWLRSDCRGVFALVGNGDMAAAPRGSGKPSLSTKLETVEQFALFAGVTSADCAAILSVGREKRLHRRQNLFSVGDAVEQVFLVLSGSVKMTQTAFGGGEVMLRVCGVGDLLGTFGLSPDDRHTSVAQIAQAGSAIVWDSGTFAKMLDHFPRLRVNTFRVLEQRLQEMEQRFRELSTDDVPSRLSSELIRLSKRFGTGVKENGEIRLSQADLAQLTGTTVPTVSRLLGRWEKLGIVSVRREAVQVHDLAALAQFSEGE